MPVNSADIEIGGHTVGAREALFVIAEIGLNHGGSFERALALVDAAADAGASAVKFQTLEADALVAPGAPAPMHVRAESLRDFFAQFELDEAAYQKLADRARRRGLVVMATPFSEPAVDMLSRVGIDAFKIASGDVTWMGLIEKCARTRKPLVISTGMSTLGEINTAIEWARSAGGLDIALLHCVSAYPVPEGSENLLAITAIADAFATPVGLSDHSTNPLSVPLAVALGASLYERHLVLEAGDGSIDAAVSSTPAELAEIIRTAARARAALGCGDKVCLPEERGNRLASRRALYATRALRAGEVIGERDLIALRPGIGLSTDRQPLLVGARVPRDIDEGMPFFESDLTGPARELGKGAKLEVGRVA